ncbi:MAG: porin family protein [Alphaproteobacteria bacterium]|nr:porin family protein [Alphaproteobacteria bacterium]
MARFAAAMGILVLAAAGGSAAIAQQSATAESAGARGFYFQGDAGYALTRETDIKRIDGPNSTIGTAAFPMHGDIGEGAAVGLSVGYDLGNAYRIDVSVQRLIGLETEMRHRQSTASSSQSITRGDVTAWTFMVGGAVHPLSRMAPDLLPRWFSPYLRAGIGLAQIEADRLRTQPGGAFSGSGPFSTPGGTATKFAWSLGAGVDLKLAERITLDVGYRYLDLGKLSYDSGTLTGPGVSEPVGRATGAELQTHTFTMGLRYRF